MIDSLLLRMFIWIGKRWFEHIMITTERGSGRTATIIFSTRYYTIDKLFRYMKKEDFV